MGRNRFAKVIRFRDMIAVVVIASFRADAWCVRKPVLGNIGMKKVICSTPASPTTSSEKPEPLLSAGSGVVANYPVSAETYPPGEDPETLAALRAAGFEIVVKGGGLTGNLKDS